MIFFLGIIFSVPHARLNLIVNIDFSTSDYNAVIALLLNEASTWGVLLLRMNGETPVAQVLSHLLADPSAEFYPAIIGVLDAIWSNFHKQIHYAWQSHQDMLDEELVSQFCTAPARLCFTA